MLKRYKNALLESIRQAGFDPTQFHVVEKDVEDFPAFIMQYQETPLKFIIRNPRDDFHFFDCKYVKFDPTYSETEYFPEVEFVSFNEILPLFRRWIDSSIQNYIDEMQEPDLWLQIDNQKSLINDSSINKIDTSNFSGEEKEELRNALQEFRMLIVERFEPSNEKMQTISNHLNYLAEATERLNRFDWRGLAVSTLIGISITLSLDTQTGRILYGLFQQAFRSAIRLLSS